MASISNSSSAFSDPEILTQFLKDEKFPKIVDPKTLSRSFRDQSKKIQANPYTPSVWIDRAQALMHIAPELALDDAYKAKQLCKAAFRAKQYYSRLTVRPSMISKIAKVMAFSLLHLKDVNEARKYYTNTMSKGDQELLTREVRDILESNETDFQPEVKEGDIRSRIKHELDEFDLETRNSFNGVGVFTKKRFNAGKPIFQKIPLRTTFVLTAVANNVEEAIADDTTAPGSMISDEELEVLAEGDASNSLTLEHSKANHEQIIGDPHIQILLRIIESCRQEGDAVSNILENHYLQRMTASYNSIPREFSFNKQVRQLQLAITEMGIDIFANETVSAWILHTALPRLEVNAFTYNEEAGIGMRYTLLNHSCNPNSEWTLFTDYLVVSAKRTIPAGEQLLVSYAPDPDQMSRAERSKYLRPYIGCDCACDLCKQQLMEESRAKKQKKRARSTSKFRRSPDTDGSTPLRITKQKAKGRMSKAKIRAQSSSERRNSTPRNPTTESQSGKRQRVEVQTDRSPKKTTKGIPAQSLAQTRRSQTAADEAAKDTAPIEPDETDPTSEETRLIEHLASK
ncbi:hypothetical protein EJ08DRAFT_713101 [Tothia fuscella]|uniref:SET domain-containing protein n=1 Tax=Tothia fuscella TaxID=1048955 RepID=A0A9P4TZ85_9PEZI|nr:hypothetical protein EJ08DRAFT_713101 [Tothia fuscella]